MRRGIKNYITCVCLFACSGTYVTQVTATDADDPTYGNSARIVYSILHGQPYFSVDPKTGKRKTTFILLLLFSIVNWTKSYLKRCVTDLWLYLELIYLTIRMRAAVGEGCCLTDDYPVLIYYMAQNIKMLMGTESLWATMNYCNYSKYERSCFE